MVSNVLLTFKALSNISEDSPCEEFSTSYGLKTTFYFSFDLVSKHLDKIIIFTFISPAMLAVYIAADRLSELLKNVFQDIAGILMPRFARAEIYTRELDRIIKISSVIIGIMVLIFIFTLLPHLLIFIYGDSYSESISYAQMLMGSVIIGNSAMFRAKFIKSKLDSVSFRDITIVMSVVRILAAILLIPLWGLMGAVVSVYLYRITKMIVVHNIIHKRYLVADNGL